jgi:hypothetical protein
VKTENFENLNSDENEVFLDPTLAVFIALDNAGIDLEAKKILWEEGEALTIAQTAERIHLQTGLELEDIENHVLIWLEVGYDPPEKLTDDEMDILESKIDNWIDEYKNSNSK